MLKPLRKPSLLNDTIKTYIINKVYNKTLSPKAQSFIYKLPITIYSKRKFNGFKLGWKLVPKINKKYYKTINKDIAKEIEQFKITIEKYYKLK